MRQVPNGIALAVLVLLAGAAGAAGPPSGPLRKCPVDAVVSGAGCRSLAPSRRRARASASASVASASHGVEQPQRAPIGAAFTPPRKRGHSGVLVGRWHRW
jgi:hypothetical protein